MPEGELPGTIEALWYGRGATLDVVGVRYDDVLNVRRTPGVDGAVIASVALMLYAIMRREARVRPDAGWTREDVLSILVAPFVTIAGAVGVVFVVLGVQRWAVVPPSAIDLVIVGLALGLTATTWVLCSASTADAATQKVKDRQRATSTPATAG